MSLEGDNRVDVLVVGAGYTGLTAALELADRGFKVAVLEAKRVGWGASGRNGGQIVTGYNQTIASIAQLVGRDDASHLWDLAEEAKQLLADRVARHEIDCDLRWGYIHAATKQRHLGELRAWYDDLIACGYSQSRLIGPDETKRLVAASGYLGALLDSGSGQLHPLRYAIGLAGAASASGVQIYENSAVERLEPGPPVVAHTAKGRVIADYAILAANAYLAPLGSGTTREIRSRIMPVGTYIVATRPLGVDRAQAIIPSGMAVADLLFVLNYYRMSSDHRLLFGGRVSYSGFDGPGLRKKMRQRMVRTFPMLDDVEIDYCWGGQVAITRNRLPHFGRLAPHILFAQGFSGQGVALTGIAGRVMAEAIAGTAGRFDVFARLPHRPFPGGPALRMPALVLAMMWYRLRDLL